MRDEALSDCTEKPSKTASGVPGTVGDRDVALDLFSGRRHDANVNPHVVCGWTVDRAVADPGGQVRVLVLLLPEKRCAEKRLEGAVDERRMEVVSDRLRPTIGAGTAISATAQSSPAVTPWTDRNASP